MARKPKGLTAKQIKAIADRAEGIEDELEAAPEFGLIERSEIPAGRPTGRPPTFKPEYIGQARKLCAIGATDAEVADFFEVSIASINVWKARHPGFIEALKHGKDGPDDRVERSLLQKALGYSFDSVKILQYEGKPVIVPFREHVPPDTTACIFWLKNRRRELWRDVHKIEHGQPGDFDRMDDNKLAEEMLKEIKEIGPQLEAMGMSLPAKLNGKTQH